jgi:hypothetical protein
MYWFHLAQSLSRLLFEAERAAPVELMAERQVCHRLKLVLYLRYFL